MWRAGGSHARKFAAQAHIGTGERIAPRQLQVAADVPADDREPADEAGGKRPTQVARVRVTDAKTREQVQLRVESELHHVTVPPGVGGVPALHESREPGGPTPHTRRR